MVARKFILMLAVAWGLSFQVSILLAQQDGKGLTKATIKESTDAYQELTRLAEPLISSSRVLAKLAEVVGPTVVHIESKKFSPSRKRWVEESGSGVITNLGPSLGIKVVTNRHVIQSARLQDADPAQLFRVAVRNKRESGRHANRPSSTALRERRSWRAARWRRLAEPRRAKRQIAQSASRRRLYPRAS